MTSSLRCVGRRTRGAASVGRAALALVGAGACAPVLAQALTIVPSIGISETLTDNRELSTDNKQTDLITQISPGIAINARRGQLQGSLSYALNGLIYARDSAENSIFHSLNSTARLSLLEGRFGVDSSAAAGRNIISAFGAQSSDPALGTSNKAQTFSYSLSPYLNGRLIGDVSYQARAAYSASRSAGTALGDSASLATTLGLFGRLGVLGWSVDASRSINETGDRPRSHNGRLGGALSYSPAYDWQLSLRAGTESDDIRTGVSERTTTWGVGAIWSPTPRTTARIELDRRFFGRSHTYSLSHRMARTVWSLSDTRSLQTGGANGRSFVSAYDLLFQLFSSVEPDVTRRDQLVRNELAARGLSPDAQLVTGGFLSASPTVQRTQTFTTAYQGLRSTLTFTYTRSNSSSIGATPGGDDLDNGALRQQGLSLTWSHRLSADATFAVTGSTQRTSSSGPQGGNDLRSLIATWSSRLGPYTNVSLGVRHQQFDSDFNPYHESAILGSFRMQF